MRKIEKIISLVLALTLVMCMGVSAFATDVEPDNPGAEVQEPVKEPEQTDPEPAEPTVQPTEPPAATPTPVPTPSPTPEAAVITKHPLAENVNTGDTIVFTAYADNTSNVSWFIVNADGSETYAGGLSSTYPGVTVSGENSNKLVINNATLKLSGCSAYARFVTLDGKFVKTNAAKITVTQAAVPTPTVKPSVTPTPKPAPTVAPTPKPVPTVSPVPVPTVAPASDTTEPDTKDDKSGDKDDYGRYERKSHAGAVVFLVLIGLVLVTTAVILVLYVKGIINLDWLENRLNGGRKAPSREDYDESEYYDDDDDEE